jgi:hypothetical protein
MSDLPNIVLVHGAWADGSSWSAAIERLHAAGYRVTSATVRDYEAGGGCRSAQARGGQIITALGTDAPNVIGLVYIAG